MVTNKTLSLKGICVGEPDATRMRSSHISLLPIPQFSISARCIHVLPAMKDLYLVSVVNTCDDGFAVNFDAKHVYLRKVQLLLIGNRYTLSGLYNIDFYTPTHPPQIENTTDLYLDPLTEPILIAKVTECICFQERVSLVHYWVLILIINTCAPNHIV